MLRFIPFAVVMFTVLLTGVLLFVGYPMLWLFLVSCVLFVIGIYDLRCSHNILRNYPVIGHLRFMLEFIRPEIQQYFINNNTNGKPYSREIRSYVYRAAKNIDNLHPFGTEHDLTKKGSLFAKHSLNVKSVPDKAARILIGGPGCKNPYNASRINISAMSFGALSSKAIMALNKGAKLANIAHDTGEGGLSPYHLKPGGDLIWQLGTAYFGCRDANGNFDENVFKDKVKQKSVKMVEIKLSQGAKPSHGGVLPAAKITPEIAAIRGIGMEKDCISPATHTAFSTPIELLNFIKKLRALSDGKPIGFKLCIGKRTEFMSICKAMLETQIYPDFITVDGSEGGSGAAPLVYSNHMGVPGDEALVFVNNCLIGVGLRHHIRIIASGKVATSFDVLKKIALGADMCNIARAMMFSIGCVQSLKCDTNKCPTGVATQDKKRSRGINVEEKAIHVMNYYQTLMNDFLHLTGAVGLDHPDQLTASVLCKQTSSTKAVELDNLYTRVQPNSFLDNKIHDEYAEDWRNSYAAIF